MRLKNPDITIPSEYLCPISYDIMTDPVITADGHSYERGEIAQWLTTSNKSPTTNCELAHKNLVPNWGLKKAIEAFIEKANSTYDRTKAMTEEQQFHQAVRESTQSFRQEQISIEKKHKPETVKSAKQKELEAKLKRLQRQCNLNPHAEKLINMHAAVLKDLGRCDEALQILHEGIQQHPDNYFLLNTRAAVYRKIGNHKAAKLDQQRVNVLKAPASTPAPQAGTPSPAVAPNKQAARSLAESAKLLRSEKKYTDALQLSLEAMKLDPDNHYILNGYADALCHMGNHSEAIKIFDRILSKQPKHKFSLTAKAYALKQLGDIQGARSCFAKILTIDPSHKTALTELQKMPTKPVRTHGHAQGLFQQRPQQQQHVSRQVYAQVT